MRHYHCGFCGRTFAVPLDSSRHMDGLSAGIALSCPWCDDVARPLEAADVIDVLVAASGAEWEGWMAENVWPMLAGVSEQEAALVRSFAAAGWIASRGLTERQLAAARRA